MYSIRNVMPTLEECTITQLYNQAIYAERDNLKPKKGDASSYRDKHRPYDQT